jgi:hypothetical protein
MSADRMKDCLFIVVVLTLPLFACNKDKADRWKDTWKMTEVYDKSTMTTSYPPAGTTRSVIVTFSGDGNFHGNTLSNLISGGKYRLLSDNRILFEEYSSTDAMEDSWGTSLRTVLSACFLQSISPCNPSSYIINGPTLKIFSPLRYDLTFTRL